MRTSRVRAAALLAALALGCAGGCAAAGAQEAVLTLPSSLRAIEEEMFCGDASIGRVVVQDGAEEIGSRAFAGSSLTVLELPESMVRIAEDALEGCGAAVIHAAAGSAAQQYARENGIPFCVADYDAQAAVAYARAWSGAGSEWGHEGYNNAAYYAYTQSNGYTGNQDCTNYVSQCLHAGGLPMDDVWYSDWKGSTAWINGYRLSVYLVDTLGHAGYEQADISLSRMAPGDVVYTKRSTGGSHVMLVSKVEDGRVYCCSHTRNHLDTGFDVSAFVYHIPMGGG